MNASLCRVVRESALIYLQTQNVLRIKNTCPAWSGPAQFLIYVLKCHVNSLTTKKQISKFSSANFRNCYVQAISYCEFNYQMANSVDLDEVAPYEPPHQDLRCLQFSYFRLW